jgi:8-oxo-dGTP pyrophosphatase MutT (NUDIX family)
MSRTPTPTWYFSLVVVRQGRRFLLVQERKHGQRWYLPAGRAEPGESLQEAALRETLEESGVPIALEGLLRLERSATAEAARVRAFFLARPADDSPPLSAPNEHSLQARWVTMEEARALPLRGEEVLSIFAYIERGSLVLPLSALVEEGAPWL